MNSRLNAAIIKVKIQELLVQHHIAIQSLETIIDTSVIESVSHLSNLTGKIIFLGVGKAGLVAKKTSATFSSLGLPSFFIHPADALHGDLGSIQVNDTCFIFSNSGETNEIVQLLPILKLRNVFVISVTGNPQSSLAKSAKININIGAVNEICHLGLAPTISTTLMMIVGDIIGVLTSQNKKFTIEEYGQNHPLGTIGKKFLTVKEIMRTNFPSVLKTESIKNVLMNITKCRTGSALIVNEENKLVGIFTDGDLRRHIQEINNLNEPIEKYMTKSPKTLSPDDKAIDAAYKFTSIRCDEFPVVDDKGVAIGLLDIQDLIKVGIEIKA